MRAVGFVDREGCEGVDGPFYFFFFYSFISTGAGACGLRAIVSFFLSLWMDGWIERSERAEEVT